MLIPIEWLKQFVKTEKSDQEIADILTLSGTNIDSVEKGVLDAEITANRGDCLSIYGVARELATFTGQELEQLENPGYDGFLLSTSAAEWSLIKQSNPDGTKTFFAETHYVHPILSVEINDETICPRYCGVIIENLQLKPSPIWLKKRLKEAGIRPINNVVDVTNYIMLETGQPLHAFDLDKIIGSPIKIRKAKHGETVITLDGIKRELDENAIVIENHNKLIDLSGIMGGQLSEISPTTKNIFLQAAVFNPIMIRKTSKKAKVTTEASYRYERGVDVTNSDKYLNMARIMMSDLTQGGATQAIDIYPNPLKEFSIAWDRKKGEDLLGIEIDPEKAISDLNKLRIITTHKEGDVYVSTPPSWRMDLCLPQDIFEEIGRFYPVNNLPRTALAKANPSPNLANYSFNEFIKDQLYEASLTEIYGYSFVSKKELEKANLDSASSIKIGNPLSEEHEYLRPSLMIDMLTAVFRNPSFDPVAIFEIGHVFPEGREENHLGIMIAGKGSQYLESVTDKLLEKIEAKIDYQITDIPKDLLDKFKIRKPAVRYIELDIDELKSNSKKENFEYQLFEMNQRYRPIAKFPSVTRDIAIIVDKNIDPNDILINIKSTDELIRNVELFDTFESDKLGVGKKSLAYHIYYQSDEKTLEDKQINELHDKVTENLEDKFQARLRQ